MTPVATFETALLQRRHNLQVFQPSQARAMHNPVLEVNPVC